MDKKLLKRIVAEAFNSLMEVEEKIYPTPNLELAELLSNAIKSEAEAITIYLNMLQHTKDKEDIAVIQEIISDEENHKVRLEELMDKYNKIPIAEH